MSSAAAMESSGWGQLPESFPTLAAPTRLVTPSGSLPWPGHLLAGFQLLAELGEGAEGRVYLARQTDLADRPVVLKVTSSRGQEHLSLARLQHSHIVPLHAVLHDPNLNLRILVMPYLGGASFADVLETLRSVPMSERTGKHILDALDQADSRSVLPSPAQGPARARLLGASYVEAVCWIGIALADGLDYAHQRGLVHLDVKPSNVLLCNDGMPMLLDFHLARPPLRPGDTIPAGLGGTPAFMPVEQHEAMAAVRERRPVRRVVDGRADLFALAATLYHALGGRVPVLPGDSPSLEAINPSVSRGLSDVLQRCLAYDAQDRYPDAASFAADLRRHLADQPLAGVPNRSWGERWRKWRRRRPAALRLTLMLLAVLGASLAGALTTWGHLSQQHRLAELSLVEGRELLEADRPAQAGQVFRRGLELIDPVPFQGKLRRQLAEEVQHADDAAERLERQQLAGELHTLVERIRFLHGGEARPAQSAEALSQCTALWQRRKQVMETLSGEDVKRDLLDLGILYADLLAGRGDVRRALTVLDEAEVLLGPSHVLHREQQGYAASLGLEGVAVKAARQAERMPVRNVWEHYALGRRLLRSADPVPTFGGVSALGEMLRQGTHELAADVVLERAAVLDPGGMWTNFARGQSAYRIGRYAEAVNAFSVCIGAAPARPECHFNRALARAALAQESAALADFEQACKLEPTLAVRASAVWQNLARAHAERGDTVAAKRCQLRAQVGQ